MKRLFVSLFEKGEQERAKRHISRSEFVASLYREYLHKVEEEERVRRYAAAYAKLPSTEEEEALTVASMELLFSDAEP